MSLPVLPKGTQPSASQAAAFAASRRSAAPTRSKGPPSGYARIRLEFSGQQGEIILLTPVSGGAVKAPEELIACLSKQVASLLVNAKFATEVENSIKENSKPRVSVAESLHKQHESAKKLPDKGVLASFKSRILQSNDLKTIAALFQEAKASVTKETWGNIFPRAPSRKGPDKPMSFTRIPPHTAWGDVVEEDEYIGSSNETKAPT